MASEQDNDLITVITSDHRAVEEVFAELESGTDWAHRKDLTDHVIAELVRHSVAEEQFVYPAAREYLENGDELADKEIREHAEAEEVMKQLEGLQPDDSQFDDLLGRLIRDVRHHIEDEENVLLPGLRAACSVEELGRLGRKVLDAKKSAPTRPHPSAPDKPPANRLLDPGVAFIDKIRDALSSRST
ncbi:hemerythrin domain-containing protein [Amycolatopsis sp. NPDC051372]|uniref:hemerythrin domain-containing protein n=1 Tax=unclassified Amycolatopsis TaxID=2618356 RepID=UPI00341A9092